MRSISVYIREKMIENANVYVRPQWIPGKSTLCQMIENKDILLFQIGELVKQRRLKQFETPENMFEKDVIMQLFNENEVRNLRQIALYACGINDLD